MTAAATPKSRFHRTSRTDQNSKPERNLLGVSKEEEIFPIGIL